MTRREDFFEVDLKQVPLPDLDPDWSASKGYTREEMSGWICQLAEIQRRMREENWRATDFERLRQSPEPAERALAETYYKFYGHGANGRGLNHDFIKLEWAGDHYEITNGRHRIWLAKQFGLATMPARVWAPDRATLERLRLDGDRAAQRPERGERSEPPAPWERSGRNEPERDHCRDRLR